MVLIYPPTIGDVSEMYDEIVTGFTSNARGNQRVDISLCSGIGEASAPSCSHHVSAPPPYVAYSTNASASKLYSCPSICNPVCQYAVILLLYSVVFLAVAVLSAIYLDAFLSYYSTLWTAVISTINSMIGIIAGISNNDRFLLAHLILSLDIHGRLHSLWRNLLEGFYENRNHSMVRRKSVFL
ncbi:hypothetical protein COOONC_04105 [Cooperia oncophora]